MHEQIALKDILEVSVSTGRNKSKYTTNQLLFYQAVLLQGITGTGSGESLVPPKCPKMVDHHQQCPVLATHDREKQRINWKCTHCKRQGTITGLDQVDSPALTGMSGSGPGTASAPGMSPGSGNTGTSGKDNRGTAGTDYPADAYPPLMPQVYLDEDEFDWMKKNLVHPEIVFDEFWEMSDTEDVFIYFPLPFLFCAIAVGILTNKTWQKKSDQEFVSTVCMEISAAAGAWFKDILYARSSNALKDKDYLYYFTGVEDLEQLTGEMDQVIRAIRKHAAKTGRSFVHTMDTMLGERGPWEYLVWPDEPPRTGDSGGKDDRYLEVFLEEGGPFFKGEEGLEDWEDFDDASLDDWEFDDDTWDEDPDIDAFEDEFDEDLDDEEWDDVAGVPHEFMAGLPPPVLTEKEHRELWHGWIDSEELSADEIESQPFIRNIRLLFDMMDREGGKLPLTQTGRFRIKDVGKLLEEGHWPPEAHKWLKYLSGKALTEDKCRFIKVFREIMLAASLIRKQHNKLQPVKKHERLLERGREAELYRHALYGALQMYDMSGAFRGIDCLAFQMYLPATLSYVQKMEPQWFSCREQFRELCHPRAVQHYDYWSRTFRNLDLQIVLEFSMGQLLYLFGLTELKPVRVRPESLFYDDLHFRKNDRYDKVIRI